MISLSTLKRQIRRLINRLSSRPPALQTFSYRTPAPDDALKQVTRLCASENLRASVQVIQREFRENLHSHRDTDGLWIVLRGRVSFFGPDDLLLGEFGPMEGIFMPRNCRYRYQSTGEETLEVMQVLSAQGGWGPDRKEHAPRGDSRGTVSRYDARHLAEARSETGK
jgi:mannose-6-phosphate isomerase-like protein (cupin superfamily)